MPTDTFIEQDLLRYVNAHRDDLIATLQTLVRTPSENIPPSGAEAACQRFCEAHLRASGFVTDLYEPDSVAGVKEHSVYYKGRDYTGRPNLGARRVGAGGGRSLALSGHIDTVPRGTLAWTRDPFSGEIENGRMYGRGSNDMKAGIATNLFVARALYDLGITLRGDLTVECVVDEEFGGVNGTLAGRLRGYVADAAIISEPSGLRINLAQRGGRTAHITLRAPDEGILSDNADGGIAAQLAWFLSQVSVFAAERRERAPKHFAYATLSNPVPVSILKLHTGPWGFKEPGAVASACKIELFWQAMPGEELDAIDAHFHDWLRRTAEAKPHLFPIPPRVEFPIRWLPGSSINAGEDLIRELSASATEALGVAPVVVGIEAPCDMYVFQQHFNMPAVLWGACGENAHQADEWVDLQSVVDAAKALLLFVYRWCSSEKPS